MSGNCIIGELPALSAILEEIGSLGGERLIRVGPMNPISKTLTGRRQP